MEIRLLEGFMQKILSENFENFDSQEKILKNQENIRKWILHGKTLKMKFY